MLESCHKACELLHQKPQSLVTCLVKVSILPIWFQSPPIIVTQPDQIIPGCCYCAMLLWAKCKYLCCFSTGRRMFPGQPWYHPTAQLHHGFPRKAVRDFVTPFVLERLFDYSCSVEFAGSYYRHVPCKFRKVCLGLKYLPQINYGGN